MGAIPEVQKFWETIEKIYVFFANSIKRWELLSTFLSGNCSLKLKRLCPTRWSSRNDSLQAVRFRYSDILKALSKIILISNSTTERNEASYLRQVMENFEFVFQVIMHTKVLTTTNLVTKALQKPDVDLSQANVLLEQAYQELREFRNDYEGAKSQAIKLSADWKVKVEFQNKRIKKTKKYFEELCQDERLSDGEGRFRVNIFHGCLDIICNQLLNRFESLKNVIQTFRVLQPKELTKITDQELHREAVIFADTYAEDIGDKFPEQLLCLRSCLKKQIEKLSSVKELANLLIIENAALSSSFQEVCTALILFLTIPVTIATAERSFSKLKIIKTYLRSTMGQERLSNLSILSIEYEMANRLRNNLDEIIYKFADSKVRRVKF